MQENINIYDSEATQKISVGDNVTAIVKPYTDERFTEYRREFIEAVNEMMRRGEAAQLEEAELKQAIEKDCRLCDDLLETLEGYEDLPADWKTLLSAEDKTAIIRRAASFVIDEDNQKISLGVIVVPTACYFNNTVARQNHILRAKTIDDSSRYALLKSKDYKVEPTKKLGASAKVEFTPQDAGRAKIYDDMRQSVEGFAGDKVPMRVKIMVVDYIFASAADQKK